MKLDALSPHARTLARNTRNGILEGYDDAFPAALRRHARVLSEGGVCGGGGGVCSVDELARVYSRRAYLETYLTLRSRAYGLLAPEAGSVWVPWLDLANHPPTSGVALAGHARLDMRYDVERAALVFSTLSAAEPGDELTYAYNEFEPGSCGGEAFRNTYGFVPPGVRLCDDAST